MRARFIPFTALLALPLCAMAEEKPAGDVTKGDGHAIVEQISVLSSIAAGKPAEHAAKWEAGLKEKHPAEFKKFDTDGDGKLSDAEAKAAVTALTATLKEKFPDLFKTVDANSDGTISADEAQAASHKGGHEHGKDNKEKEKDAPAPAPEHSK